MRPPAAHITEVRARQLGSDLLILEIEGGALALPTFHTEEGTAGTLRWMAAVHKKADGTKPFDVKTDLPLAHQLRFCKEDANGLRLEVFGEKPLRLKAVKGTSGADRITVELQSAVPSYAPETKRSAAGPGQEIFSGPVTLELRDVSAYEAFHVLAACAGANLLFESAVPAKKISLSFKDVPFRQVFSYLLRTYGFHYGYAGGTLVVGSAERVAKILGLDRTKTYTIAYADIDKVAHLIRPLAGLSETPAVDQRMRQLYVTGTEAQHRKVASLIEKLDHPGRQIMLEARLIEVNKEAKEELETLISAVYKGWAFSSGVDGGSVGYSYINRTEGAAVDPTLKMLDAGLRAIETRNRGKVLASPSVMALDGERAVIKLTRNYLYQSSIDDKGNAEFTEQETGPTLEITPFIGRDGYITMRLNISTGEIVAFRKTGLSEAPETTKRELETRIRVRDGELFVIGGLYQETRSKSVTRVPVLGYIPLAGELFTNRQTKNLKSEMAFIVVPHILDIPCSGAEVFTFGEDLNDDLGKSGS